MFSNTYSPFHWQALSQFQNKNETFLRWKIVLKKPLSLRGHMFLWSYVIEDSKNNIFILPPGTTPQTQGSPEENMSSASLAHGDAPLQVEEGPPPDMEQLEEGAIVGIRGLKLHGSGSSSATSDEGEMWGEADKHWTQSSAPLQRWKQG